MKERPILFKPENIRAMLREISPKNQTRRVINPQPDACDHSANEAHEGHPIPTEFYCMDRGDWACRTCGNGIRLTKNDAVGIRCPYGVPGDRLWVRETYATDSIRTLYYATDDVHELRKRRSAMFMPRTRSRITLEITEVRIERVQDISVKDCIAEGLCTNLRESEACDDLKDQYHALWDSINKKKYPWSSNPWVWVITYKRV